MSELSRTELIEELACLYDTVEREVEGDPPSAPPALGLFVAGLRAVALGTFSAGLSTFAIFVILNLLFHFSPN